MAGRFEFVNVICLEQGATFLPTNVRVWSLGKDIGRPKLIYLLNFYRYIWRLRHEYDSVFVHMNREYVIFGGLLWRFWGKQVVLWYNHKKGDFLSCLAGFLANTVLFTSNFSFFAKWTKAMQMPVGIDTDIFKKNVKAKICRSILCLSRIDAVKNIDILVEAGKLLDKKNLDFKIFIYGASTHADDPYFLQLKKDAEELVRKNKLEFLPPVANRLTPELYNRYKLFVNLTNSGSLDKTILEAMACETPVLVSNRFFENVLPQELSFKERDSNDLVNRLEKFWQMPETEKQKYNSDFRQYVIKRHGLDLLLDKLVALFAR